MRILILSDIHYACEKERARGDFRTKGVANPVARFLVGRWSEWLWEGDPFARNEAFHRFLERDFHADLVVANGDYSVDSGFIGMADPAAHESALFVLRSLKKKFGDRLHSIVGDHELGKVSPDGGRGGMRLEAFRKSLALPTVHSQWRMAIDNLVLLGVNSTLLAIPVLERDMLPTERGEWDQHRLEHLEWIATEFESLKPDQRIILFCHDPTGIPYLHRIEAVASRLDQVEHTVIGHLHSRWILNAAGKLAGFPRIRHLGAGVERVSRGLNESACWKDYSILFCPALDGIKWHSGACLMLDIDPSQPSRNKVTVVKV